MALSFQEKIKPVAPVAPTVTGQETTTPPRTGQLSFASKITPIEKPRTALQIAGDLAGGALYGFSAPGRTIQNLASAGVDKLFGTEGFGKATKEGFEKSTGTDLDTTSGKIGNVVGETLPYLIPTRAAAGAASKGVALAGRVGLNTAIGTAQSGDIKEGLAIGLGSEVLGAAAKPFMATGKAIAKLPIANTARDAFIEQVYKSKNTLVDRIGAIVGAKKIKGGVPQLTKDTAFDFAFKGTAGQIGVQARRASQKLWKDVVSPALQSVEQEVDINKFFDAAAKDIVEKNADNTAQRVLLKALNTIKKDYKDTTAISIERLQKLKESWSKPLPESAFSGKDIVSPVNQLRKDLSDKARNTIHSLLDDPVIRKAYIDYGNMVGLRQLGIKAETGKKFSTDILNKLKNNILEPVLTIGGRVIYRTAQGVEFIAPAGMKNLYELFTNEE